MHPLRFRYFTFSMKRYFLNTLCTCTLSTRSLRRTFAPAVNVWPGKLFIIFISNNDISCIWLLMYVIYICTWHPDFLAWYRSLNAKNIPWNYVHTHKLYTFELLDNEDSNSLIKFCYIHKGICNEFLQQWVTGSRFWWLKQ